jgi:hypothetical protein
VVLLDFTPRRQQRAAGCYTGVPHCCLRCAVVLVPQ